MALLSELVSLFLANLGTRLRVNDVSPRGGGGGYSTEVWVRRCGWAAQTPTLFKTEISDFATLFKTEISDFLTLFKTACSFLRPGLHISNQNSLSSFDVAQASGISANKNGYKFGFCTIFTNLSVRASCLNIRIPCLRQKVMKSIPRLRQNYKPENHTLSGRTSPLRPYKGEPPGDVSK